MSDTTKLPKIGEQFQGGLYAGITTGKDGAPYALVLLTDKPVNELTWKKAVSWAQGLGADLPSRPESALLFALLKDKFEPTWHWTNETTDWSASYAWYCDFDYGDQGYNHESAGSAAVAVRRFPLESFDSFKVAL